LNNWRIYRLPGSREVWHIDSGPDTKIFNVRGYESSVISRSVDIGGMNVPRAWIEIGECDLHLVNGFAVFTPKIVVAPEKCVHAETGSGKSIECAPVT
jgi:hypothetical protein